MFKFTNPLNLLLPLLIVASVATNGWSHGPENVLVVVNADSDNSIELANHYISLRNIPGRNVVYIRNITSVKASALESIYSKYYRAEILEPVHDAIKERGLEQQIHCITYSVDIPTRILSQPEMNKYLKAVGKEYDIHFHAPFLSMNSATYIGDEFFANEPTFLEQHANWYAQDSSAPTRAFSSQAYWTKDGQPTGDATNGRRYMLSSMLAVVRENGSTMKQAMEQLERSATADGTKPQGEFYFVDNQDPRSRTRKSQFAPAAEELKKLGFDVEIGSAAMPSNKTILGATLGSASVDWRKGKSKFVPGALCDNFTSYGAWWEKSQTKVTHFLNQGAAAATGMVYEPYTIAYKIPTTFAHVHYVKGCTVAEAIYQTVLNPFQMLVVGDPLCRPFADLPEFTLTGVTDRSLVGSDLKIETSEVEGKAKIDHYDVYIDGILHSSVNPNQPIQIAIADLTPAYHELRIVAVSDSISGASVGQAFDIFVRSESHKAPLLRLKLEKSEIQSDDKLSVSCQFPDDITVELRQNFRVIGKFKSSEEPIVIDAKTLGNGKSRVYATAKIDGQLLSGVPQEVNVVSK